MAEYYVNFSENKSKECPRGLRSWEDARRYGFISAGHNAFDKVEKLDPGDSIWVYCPGHGYVGYGSVFRSASPAEIATLPVGENGVDVPFFSLALSADYANGSGGLRENIVAVKWQVAVPLSEAVYAKRGELFSHQQIVCDPEKFTDEQKAIWSYTVSHLQELWGIK